MPVPADDPYRLSRFVEAQGPVYETALHELRSGKKRTHWIWYVLPQLAGLGSSTMSAVYAIASLAEAQAYLAHPILGTRLAECVAAMNAHTGASAVGILGEVDAAKFRSCLTLFARAAGTPSVYGAALDRYYAGEPDPRTLALLA